ncbi:universal stress protein [Polaribacter sp. Asnod1-A03]|uniref:universal stress protein n=1 Tax=Polaribacter sp. Asnod1-A03 TaxID=3160581 RepID=UPI00387078D7
MSILVATNFSKLSDNAVLYAASLAKQFNTKLIIFNAFKLPIHAANSRLSANSLDVFIEINRQKLKKITKEIKQKFNVETEFKCRFSTLEDEIEELMTLYKARFLVIGMSPKSMEQNLLGNPTTTLISLKRFPVLAIPIKAKFTGLKKILFACDLLDDIPLKKLVKLRQIAVELKSDVTVFYVDKRIDNMKTITNDSIDRGLNEVTLLYKNVKSKTVLEEIKKEIEKSKSELLVMIPKKYGFWESLLHKSKTREMASGLDIPLFSISIE